jgi:hypothetical protein
MIKRWLMWLWQAPQNILALILALMCKCNIYYKVIAFRGWSMGDQTTVIVCGSNSYTACSLGRYIFIFKTGVDYSTNYSNEMWLHEKGHCKQSRRLGPLYLIVVGIPSLVLNLLARVNKYVDKNYYNLYPEKWADRLGGVPARNGGVDRSQL